MDLNEEQFEVLNQFKSRVSDILNEEHTDTLLLKFLRARNNNPEKAAALFRKDYDSRIFYEVEEIKKSYKRPEVIDKYGFTSFLGFAKDGSVVRYTAAGKGDHIGFIMSLSLTNILRHCVYLMELDLLAQRNENKRTGRDVHEITYIFDFENFNLQSCAYRCAIETGLDLIRLLQDHYPECWGNIFCINTPMYFDTAFNIVKPVLRMNILQRIKVVAKDSTGKLLRKYIDEDVLPVFLGGERTDSKGDPRCSEFLTFGGKIPQSYYLKNHPWPQITDPGFKNVWVRPGTVFNYTVEVPADGYTLSAYLRSENGSIFYKIFYRPFGNNPEISDIPATNEYLDENDPKCRIKYSSPTCRLQTHVAPIEDKCKAPWPGIYIFQCDNTRSWFSYRRVIFRFQAIPPE